MVMFSDQIPFLVRFVILEPENVLLSSGFSAVTLVSSLECEHWPLKSDVAMSSSQNGETLSHRWWQQADTRVLLAAHDLAPNRGHLPYLRFSGTMPILQSVLW